MIRTFLIDFGGVVAEEGFREGLRAIAKKNGLDPGDFFFAADVLIHATGYLTGRAGEAVFWQVLRERTGITGRDQELKEEILSRFVLRQDMIDCIDLLRSKGFVTAMLSDQTNWLDEIDARTGLFRHFDRVLNSYHIHKSKRDAATFRDVCGMLGIKPEETVFIDDNKGHVERAADTGLNAVHFTNAGDVRKKLGLLTGISCGT